MAREPRAAARTYRPLAGTEGSLLTSLSPSRLRIGEAGTLSVAGRGERPEETGPRPSRRARDRPTGARRETASNANVVEPSYTLRDVAPLIECPECGAISGEPCRDRRKDAPVATHPARREAARQLILKLAEIVPYD